jgi:hypothetical protein
VPKFLSDALTDLKVKNLKPKAKPYKVTDGRGLALKVTPVGGERVEIPLPAWGGG